MTSSAEFLDKFPRFSFQLYMILLIDLSFAQMIRLMAGSWICWISFGAMTNDSSFSLQQINCRLCAAIERKDCVCIHFSLSCARDVTVFFCYFFYFFSPLFCLRELIVDDLCLARWSSCDQLIVNLRTERTKLSREVRRKHNGKNTVRIATCLTHIILDLHVNCRQIREK